MVKSKPATVTKVAIKKFIDKEITHWMKQTKLHISKRVNYTPLNQVIAIIGTYQNMRIEFVGSKKKL